jgi:hypothetical protein
MGAFTDSKIKTANAPGVSLRGVMKTREGVTLFFLGVLSEVKAALSLFLCPSNRK